MKYSLLLCALLAIPAQAQMADGNKLYSELQKSANNNLAWGFAYGYVGGVFDANTGVSFCAPSEVTLGQATAMTEKFLAENPAIRHFAASAIIVHVLSRVWPCAKKGTTL